MYPQAGIIWLLYLLVYRMLIFVRETKVGSCGDSVHTLPPPGDIAACNFKKKSGCKCPVRCVHCIGIYFYSRRESTVNIAKTFDRQIHIWCYPSI